MATVVRRVVNNVNTVVLHGNDYVEVHERFRILHELKKDFETLESGPLQVGERLLWRVVAKIDGKQYVAHAEVKLGASKGTPDGTNPFECAETSAWGRLLGFAGLGTVQGIASYDEIVRSQPFTQVIEQSGGKIVESRATQIEAPRDETVKAATPTLYEAAFKLKKRALEQRVVTSDGEWKAMLDYLEIEQFASGSDLAKVNGKIAETLKAREGKAS